jgi:effector-binding domain-containing protein
LSTAQQAAVLEVEDTKTILSAVKKPHPVSFWAIVLDFTGTFQDVDGQIARLRQEVTNQKLDESLRGFSTKSILILREDPTTKKQGSMAIGLTVPGFLQVKAPLKMERIQFSKAIIHVHTGPHQELGKIHGEIIAALRETSPSKERAGAKAGWPVILGLLNDPKTVQPNEVQTELTVPLEDELLALGSKELAAIRRAVHDAQPLSYLLVTQKFHGSVDQLSDFLTTFLGEFTSQDLGASLPGPHVVPLALLHQHPTQKTIDIEIGFPVKQRIEVRPPLAIVDFRLDKAAVYNHLGDFKRLFPVYEEIVGAIQRELPTTQAQHPEAGLPIVLRLLTDPEKVQSPAEIRTDIIVPIAY